MASIDDKLSHEEQSAFLKFVKNYEETKGYYDRNAANYDNFYKMSIGVFPIVGTRELIKHLTDVTLLKDVKIADIGAGTGAVGQLLKEIILNTVVKYIYIILSDFQMLYHPLTMYSLASFRC